MGWPLGGLDSRGRRPLLGRRGTGEVVGREVPGPSGEGVPWSGEETADTGRLAVLGIGDAITGEALSPL